MLTIVRGIAMPAWSSPKAIEIDKKLRDDFRRMLREYSITTQETDPVLAVLFRSLATQVEAVYQQAADSIPRAMLDELIAGLGLPERGTQAAQTVVHLTLQAGRERLAVGTELIGEAPSKEKLTFALDTDIEVSAARISLIAIYHERSLRLHMAQSSPKCSKRRGHRLRRCRLTLGHTQPSSSRSMCPMRDT
jgi:hypothetical protein